MRSNYMNFDTLREMAEYVKKEEEKKKKPITTATQLKNEIIDAIKPRVSNITDSLGDIEWDLNELKRRVEVLEVETAADRSGKPKRNHRKLVIKVRA